MACKLLASLANLQSCIFAQDMKGASGITIILCFSFFLICQTSRREKICPTCVTTSVSRILQPEKWASGRAIITRMFQNGKYEKIIFFANAGLFDRSVTTFQFISVGAIFLDSLFCEYGRTFPVSETFEKGGLGNKPFLQKTWLFFWKKKN